MAGLCCGEQYLDADGLIRSFQFDMQQNTAETKQVLENLIREPVREQHQGRSCQGHKSAVPAKNWTAHHNGSASRTGAAGALSDGRSHAAAPLQISRHICKLHGCGATSR